MGYSIIILAVLNIFDFVILTSIYLLGFSMAALFFSLNELLEYKANEKNDPYKYSKIKYAAYLMAVISFMVIPVLSHNWSEEIIVKASEFATLLSIGIVFYILGLKQERVASDRMKQIIDQMINESVQNYTENDLPNAVNRLIDEEFVKKLTTKAIDEISKQQIHKKN